jgi:hypothetical protein
MSHLVKKPFRAIALVAAFAALTVAGVAYASIPDGNGVIHGCYKPASAGATGGTPLNILDDASASCGTKMQPIAWNQTGPAGPPGVSGYEIVRVSVLGPAGSETIAQAACPAGKRVLGGAGSVQGVPTGVWLHTGVTDFPGFSGYDVYAVNTTAQDHQINSTAICANVG